MADVTASYIGQSDNGKYSVNVKPMNVPAGNLGGGGFVQYFDTKEDAEAFVEAVNNNQNIKPNTEDSFTKTTV